MLGLPFVGRYCGGEFKCLSLASPTFKISKFNSIPGSWSYLAFILTLQFIVN